MNKCLNCGEDVKRNTRSFCSNKCRGDYKIKINPLEKYEVKCFKCNKKFEIKERRNSFPSKEKYYCSRKCANSRKWGDDHKKKLSDVCRNSEKVKITNKILGKNRIKKKIMTKKCPVCRKEFDVFFYNKKRIYCSKDCYLKDDHNEFRRGGKGGYRFGTSGKNHSGTYKGYWCDSSWELAFVIYNLDHNIKFERNLQDFKYIHNGIERKYYPDFITENKSYLEIKGYFRETDLLKIEQFPYKLEVLDKIKMKPILKYVKSKYGKNFIKLYEK